MAAEGAMDPSEELERVQGDDGGTSSVLVTLLCPCYNAAAYLPRFLDSIAAQTFRNIQVILVDDGSTDETLPMLEAWRDANKGSFEDVLVLSKPNGGAASAVNAALPYVRGDYLSWADADDVLRPCNIEAKVRRLESDAGLGLVVGAAVSVNEGTGEEISRLDYDEGRRPRLLFERLIFDGVPCYPGVFMIRMALLRKRLRKEGIFCDPEVGQNWQLLLPVAYDNACGYVDDVLYEYHVRPDSHSRGVDYERAMHRTDAQKGVLMETLWFLREEELAPLAQAIDIKYATQRLMLAIANRDSEAIGANLDAMARLSGSPMGGMRAKLTYYACKLIARIRGIGRRC